MSFRIKLGELTFPVAPSKISVSQKSRNRTVDLIDGSQTVISRAPALREYHMELLLPRAVYPFAVYEKGFLPPEHFVNAVEEYARAGLGVELVITRGEHTESCTVYIGDMACTESAENGEDVILTLTLLENGESTVYARTPDSYTVRAGDTLRLIARKVWGDETLWNYLYGFNVDLIETAAKRAGYLDSRFGERLMTGLKLVIPQEVGSHGKRS